MPETTPKSITPRDLFNLREQTKLRVVDVRFPKAFDKFRAKRCKNIPLYRAFPEALAQEIAPENTLYIICKNGSVGRRLVENYSEMFKSQNREIVFVEGGLKAWAEEGLPTFRAESRWSRPSFQCGFLVWFTIILLAVLASVFHRGFLGIASFIMAGIIFFATLSDATPLTNLLAKMPWNRRNREAARTDLVAEAKDPAFDENLPQQPATHEIT